MYTQGYKPPENTTVARQQAEDWRYAMPTGAQAARGKKAKQPVRNSKPAQKPPRKRKSMRWQLIKVFLMLLVLAGAGTGIYIWKTQADVRPYTSVFVDNIYVDGINLSGMTWDEGSSAVQKQINDKLNSWYVRLKNSAGEYKDITAQTLGISSDPSEALLAAWQIGHDTDATERKDIFELKDEIEAAKATTYAFSSVEQSGDTSAIDSILVTLARAAYVAPQDAVMLGFNPDNTTQPFTFQREVVGKELNVQVLREQILQMVATFTSGEVLVEPDDVLPSVTVADLQKNYSLRFRAVTPIDSHSTEARNANIGVAFSHINGMVLANGDKFSFNDVVGRRTQKNGFYQAFEYSYGELVTGWGGGVCQASTTVYLAAVQAGMKIIDHTAHSTPVSYTNLGEDATVSDTRGHEVDFGFKNTSGGNIYMAAHVITDPSNSKRYLCEVRIYGLDLGTTSYSLETEVVETLPKPSEPEIIEDTKAKYVTYTDEEKTVIEASEGHVVDTYLVTTVDGVQTERTKIATSTYKNRAARIYVGVTVRGVE